MVKFRDVTLSIASNYANLFNRHSIFCVSNEGEEFFDNEDAFVFKNEREQLTVFKNSNKISYRLLQKESSQGIAVNSEKDAAKLAVGFLKKNRLPFSYEDIFIDFCGEFYNVKLINNLNGIALHAFNNVITVDIYGNVVSLDYFNVDFLKYGSSELLDIQRASERSGILIPEEIFKNGKISIVYVYENSIVVPGYLVEGRLRDGGSFRQIISAAGF